MARKRKFQKLTAQDKARRAETRRMAQERIAYHEGKPAKRKTLAAA